MYTYDALGRRIRKVVENRGELDGTTLYYYNHRWQLLETRDGSESLDMQIVHGTQYIDEIVRFGKVGRGGMFIYQDANWNVTSAVGFSGIVLDRVTTTPYGQPTFDTHTVNGDYDGDGDLDSSDDSQLTTCINTSPLPSACRMYDYDLDGDVDTADETHFDNLYAGSDVITRRMGQGKSFNRLAFAHQGLLHDCETKSVYNRFRNLSPALGAFNARDPLGYIPGMNFLAYVGQNPIRWGDPYGLEPDAPDDGSPGIEQCIVFPDTPGCAESVLVICLVDLDTGELVCTEITDPDPEPEPEPDTDSDTEPDCGQFDCEDLEETEVQTQSCPDRERHIRGCFFTYQMDEHHLSERLSVEALAISTGGLIAAPGTLGISLALAFLIAGGEGWLALHQLDEKLQLCLSQAPPCP